MGAAVQNFPDMFLCLWDQVESLLFAHFCRLLERMGASLAPLSSGRDREEAGLGADGTAGNYLYKEVLDASLHEHPDIKPSNAIKSCRKSCP